jgi:peptidoglycan/LPS O-acetylase OafA/YrhL
MEHPKAAAGRFYRPELDVVRFLAFLLVFLHHTLPSATDPRVATILKGFSPYYVALSTACGFGLSLFFTLSAFLICELLLREHAIAGVVGVKQFYIRRILRIWPLYYFGLALGLLVMFLPGGHPDEIACIGWFAIFMGAWRIATQHWFNSPAEVLWSVSVEEQFYLFAPWIVKYFSRKLLYGFCLLLILVANVWLYYLGMVSANHHSVCYNSFVQYECFAGGILLCLVLRGRLPNLAIWQRLVLLAFSLFCWFYACYRLHPIFGNRGELNPGSWHLIGGYALATLGCILLLVAFLGVTPKLLPEWAVYLGRISFGLYVYHDFAIYLTDHLFIGYIATFKYLRIVRLFEAPIFVLNWSLTLGLTILTAALSYRYLETPFLKMKRQHAVIDSQPIAGAG